MLVHVAHRDGDVQVAVGAPVVGPHGDQVLVVPVGVGGTVVVGGVAEGQVTVPADEEVAAVPAGQAPAGDGLPLRVRRQVGVQGEGRVPVLLDGDGLLAGDHRSLVLVCDGDGDGEFPGFALGVPGLHRHQVLVAVGAGPAGTLSKLGGLLKVRTPLPLLSVVMVKSLASRPPRRQVKPSPSGSVAR